MFRVGRVPGFEQAESERIGVILWLCFRVNGLRLAYGYYPGWGVDESCQETGGKQELAQLCKLMLKSVDKHHKGVYGVFVSLLSLS